MALICDKCKQPTSVTKNFKGTGIDLCGDCVVSFEELLEKTIGDFTNTKKKKNLLKDIGGVLFGPKK